MCSPNLQVLQFGIESTLNKVTVTVQRRFGSLYTWLPCDFNLSDIQLPHDSKLCQSHKEMDVHIHLVKKMINNTFFIVHNMYNCYLDGEVKHQTVWIMFSQLIKHGPPCLMNDHIFQP